MDLQILIQSHRISEDCFVSNLATERTSHDYNLNVFSRGYSGFAPVGNITFGFKF
jgi:hypothetical protein